jgi:hypothetical protein
VLPHAARGVTIHIVYKSSASVSVSMLHAVIESACSKGSKDREIADHSEIADRCDTCPLSPSQDVRSRIHCRNR